MVPLTLPQRMDTEQILCLCLSLELLLLFLKMQTQTLTQSVNEPLNFMDRHTTISVPIVNQHTIWIVLTT